MENDGCLSPLYCHLIISQQSKRDVDLCWKASFDLLLHSSRTGCMIGLLFVQIWVLPKLMCIQLLSGTLICVLALLFHCNVHCLTTCASLYVRIQYFPQNNDEETRQPETRAIMSWIRSTQFTASASFHEVHLSGIRC